MLDFLNGKKTYIVMLLGIAVLVLRNPLGLEIPGVAADPEWVMHLLGFLGLGTTRKAIADKASW